MAVPAARVQFWQGLFWKINSSSLDMYPHGWEFANTRPNPLRQEMSVIQTLRDQRLVAPFERLLVLSQAKVHPFSGVLDIFSKGPTKLSEF